MKKMSQTMKGLWPIIIKAAKLAAGFCRLPLVYLGVALLAIGYLFGLNDYDLLLVIPLLMILLGIIGEVRHEKHVSTY